MLRACPEAQSRDNKNYMAYVQIEKDMYISLFLSRYRPFYAINIIMTLI